MGRFAAGGFVRCDFPDYFRFYFGQQQPLGARISGAWGKAGLFRLRLLQIGAGITLFGAAHIGHGSGIVLGLMTVLLSGGGAMFVLHTAWYALRKRPRPARNVLAGACESAVVRQRHRHAGGHCDGGSSALLGIQDAATAQIATAVVVTAFFKPVCGWLILIVGSVGAAHQPGAGRALSAIAPSKPAVDGRLAKTKPPIGRLCKERGLLRGRCRCFALSRTLEAFRFHPCRHRIVRGSRLPPWVAAHSCSALLYCGVAAGSLLLRLGASSPLLAQADKIRAKAGGCQ